MWVVSGCLLINVHCGRFATIHKNNLSSILMRKKMRGMIRMVSHCWCTYWDLFIGAIQHWWCWCVCVVWKRNDPTNGSGGAICKDFVGAGSWCMLIGVGRCECASSRETTRFWSIL